MKIPFVDLKAQYESIKPEVDGAIAKVISDTAFIKGSFVSEFEEAYREKYSVKHCIGVGNGTDAIYIALRMMGIGEGDEVITTASSWISTSEAISQTGARPVFVDIDPDYYTLDPSLVEDKITPRTRAIIPVHLYGQIADMETLMGIAGKHKLLVLEDCAQAHLAEQGGKLAGTFGEVATFSFFPGKNLGAYGDAGAVITNDDELARKIRMFANHGAMVKHTHEFEGVNSRLDGMQAAILSAKLPHLDQWTGLRIKLAARYSEMLATVKEVHCPPTRPDSKHVFHVYNIRCERRDQLRAHLEKAGVSVAIHYPTALPNMPAYKYLGHKESDFPVASSYSPQILSLPIYPEMGEDLQGYVVERIREFYSA